MAAMLLDLDFDVSTAHLRPVDLSAAEWRGVEQFIFHEARLLDERRLDEWLALWTSDGMYWIPREHGQTSPYDHISIAWEDAMLREVRATRLKHPRNWSQLPPTRSARVLGNLIVDGETPAGELAVRATFQLSEFRQTMQLWAGAITFKLKPEGSAWKLHMKRVDLINCDAMLPNIEVFL